MSVAMHFVEDRLGQWIEFGRDLHQHPELGFTEYRTQARIAERLEALGYRLRLGCEVMREEEMLGLPPSPALADAREAAVASGARSDLVRRMGEGMTGLVAELSSGGGPVIAMRFDRFRGNRYRWRRRLAAEGVRAGLRTRRLKWHYTRGMRQ
jgi:metal-dependent amidase/aminoacylase/carboxypeptidase family protein